MRWLWKLVMSSIGAKVLMAATGVVLIVFLIGHFIGNLQVFGGPDLINSYGVLLHKRAWLLWLVRAGLIVAFLTHVSFSLRLTYLNRRARPEKYTRKQAIQATLASRNMLVSGSFVFAFVVYHLLQFTVKLTNPAYARMRDALGRPDIYAMVETAFHNPYIFGGYVFAMLLLGLHLWHSINSMFQSTGTADAHHNRLLQAGSIGLAAIIVLGFLSIPIGIWLGLASEVH